MPRLSKFYFLLLLLASSACTGVHENQRGPAAASCPVTPAQTHFLNDYILCQSSPALASCAGLATMRGGRPVLSNSREFKYPELLDKNFAALSEELAEQIYNAEHDGDQMKIKFTDLAPSLQVFYFQQARNVITKLLQQATLGNIDDYLLSLIVRTGVSFSKKVSVKVFAQKIAPVLEYLKNVVARSSPMLATRIPVVAMTETGVITAEQTFITSQMVKSATPLVVGHIIGALSLALGAAGDYFASTTPVGCAEYGDFYVHKDENCKPVYSINENVINFLNLKDEEQLQYLNTPSAPVCRYYEKLLDTVFTQPTFIGLECTSQGFTLKVQDPDGKKRSLKAMYRYKTREIKQISLDHPNPLEINKDGSIRGIEASSHIAREAIPLKLYIMDAYDCCNANEENKKICLDIYNGR